MRSAGVAALALVAFAVADAAIVGAASAVSSVALAEVIGVVAGLVTVAGGLVLVLRGRWWRARRVAPWVAAGLALWAAAFWATTLRPLDVRPPADRVPGQRVWRLSTGARIAYVRIPAPQPGRRAPVVYLHGGPGVSELPDVVGLLAPLARSGHDVLAYDQLGAGRSARLADPRGYTLERALADLEAIRLRLRAPKLVLVGHSWGATLAAAYLARHPGRVAGVVFTSPGALQVGDDVAPGDPAVRLTSGEKLALYGQALRPRSLLAYALTVTHPRFAHAFAGDAEMDHRFAALFAKTRPGLLCDGRLAGQIATDGVGHYANQLTRTDQGRFDPRPLLSDVHVPALVLHGACDYEPAANARAYVAAIPGARLVEIAGAGHQLYVERPARYRALIGGFLAALR